MLRFSVFSFNIFICCINWSSIILGWNQSWSVLIFRPFQSGKWTCFHCVNLRFFNGNPPWIYRSRYEWWGSPSHTSAKWWIAKPIANHPAAEHSQDDCSCACSCWEGFIEFLCSCALSTSLQALFDEFISNATISVCRSPNQISLWLVNPIYSCQSSPKTLNGCTFFRLLFWLVVDGNSPSFLVSTFGL